MQPQGDIVKDLENYRAGLDAAYQGEYFGIAMYRRIAAARQTPDEMEKWHLLARLEEVTRSVLEPVLHRHDMETGARAESTEAGERDAENYMNLPWDQLMRRFIHELDADIDEYSALLEIAPPSDHDAIRFLVDHEIVAKTFCERELDGKTGLSVEPVEALIERGASLMGAP